MTPPLDTFRKYYPTTSGFLELIGKNVSELYDDKQFGELLKAIPPAILTMGIAGLFGVIETVEQPFKALSRGLNKLNKQ